MLKLGLLALGIFISPWISAENLNGSYTCERTGLLHSDGFVSLEAARNYFPETVTFTVSANAAQFRGRPANVEYEDGKVKVVMQQYKDYYVRLFEDGKAVIKVAGKSGYRSVKPHWYRCSR